MPRVIGNAVPACAGSGDALRTDHEFRLEGGVGELTGLRSVRHAGNLSDSWTTKERPCSCQGRVGLSPVTNPNLSDNGPLVA
jgi:hypothetical protein